MYTHKQLRNMNRRWKRAYGAGIPRIIKAQRIADNNRIGIHLLNPTKDEISRAYCDASRDMFAIIVIHTRRTFRFLNHGSME